MNKNLNKKIISIALSSMILTNTVFAQSSVINKSETVYVLKEDENIKDKTVSVWLNSEENIKGKDKTNLKKVKNLKTDEQIKDNNGYINWDENVKDIYYQGKSEKEIPVDVNVEYYLDGEKIQNSQLKGKSGHLKIVLSAENYKYVIKKINGKKTKIYAPYTVVVAMTLGQEIASNIESDDAKIVKDGKNQVITSVLTPGLKENFETILEDRQMEEFRNEVEIEMDIKDYEPAEIYALISNELFQNEVNIKSIDKLRNGVRELEDNSQKLVDASEKLSDAQHKLNDGLSEMGGGVKKLHDGSDELYEKSGEFEDKFDEVIEKVKPVPGYAEEMYEGGNKLTNGINDYTSAVGKMNEKTGEMKDGAKKLKDGSVELDDGIGKLKDATTKLREGSSKLSKVDELKNQAMTKLLELKDGIGKISAGANNLNEGATKASASVAKLVEGEKEFDTGLQRLNSKVKEMNIPDLSRLGTIDVKSDLQSIGNSAGQIGGSVQEIQNAIAILSRIQNSEAEQAIKMLTVASQNIGQNAQNIETKTQTIGNNLQGLKQLSGMAAQLKDLQALQAGMGQLAENSSKINAGLSQLPEGLQALQAGTEELYNGANKINSELEKAMNEASSKLDTSQITKLSDSLIKLDDATTKLKEGSTKLREGTEQSEEGVNKFTDAIAELDSNSSKLNSGANELSNGLLEFKDKSKMFNDFPRLKTEGIVPMRNGIKKLTDGIVELDSGTIELKDGSSLIDDNMKFFVEKLLEFKQKGIDELDRKTQELPEFKEIVDTMSDLAREENSFTGTSEGFDTKSRIIEKIK